MNIYNDINKIKPENDIFHILNIVKPITQNINNENLTNIIIDKNDTIDVINYLEYKNYDIFLLMYINKFITNDFTWINQSLDQFIDNFKRLIIDDIVKTIFPICEEVITNTSSKIMQLYSDIDKLTLSGKLKLNNNTISIQNLYNIVKMTPTKDRISNNELSTETTNNKVRYKLFLKNWLHETRLIKLVQKLLLFDDNVNIDTTDINIINTFKEININIIKSTQLLKYVIHWIME